jgi:hypothetical protein
MPTGAAGGPDVEKETRPMTPSATVQTPETPEEIAARPSQVLGREQAAWEERRVTQQQRIEAIGLALEQLTVDLAAARREALEGKNRTASIAALVAQQRTLEAERDERGELLEVAANAEQEVAIRNRDALHREAAEREAVRARFLLARGVELDAAIDAAIREVMWPLLVERKTISEEAIELKRRRQDLATDLDRGAVFVYANVPALSEPGPRPRINNIV